MGAGLPNVGVHTQGGREGFWEGRCKKRCKGGAWPRAVGGRVQASPVSSKSNEKHPTRIQRGTYAATLLPNCPCAQWNVDDKGYRVGVFDNRTAPFEHNLPTQTRGHSGPQYETSVRTAPVTDNTTP